MKALLVIGSIAALLVLAGTAGATAGNGAIVLNDSTCNPTPIGLLCSTVKTITNVTTTPSGNRSYVTNGTIELAFANPFCTISQPQAVHRHYLQKDGELQSLSERTSFTNQIQCVGLAQTCTTTLELHYANGDFQFNRPDTFCTTP